MSCFAGAVNLDGNKTDHSLVRRMLMYAWAPKHQQLEQYSDRIADLAIRQSSGKEGMFFDDSVAVVADCRLNDIESLCGSLNIPSSEQNAGMIIAAAYKKWGEAIVYHITGEFAFALWDVQKRQLFCARDRFGRVPLCYCENHRGISVCSDFAPIAATQSNESKVNRSWIIQYVHGLVSDEESTPFEGIYRLPPGCIMKWSEKGLTVRRYWSFSDVGPTIFDITIPELAVALEASVQKRIDHSNTVAMLSGGLDSSTLAIIARDLRRKKQSEFLPVVSLVHDDYPEESERSYIESVLETGGFEASFVNVRDYDALSEIKRLVQIQGAPSIARGAPVFDQAIAEVQRLGFDFALDGHGGDEIISSNGAMRFTELASGGHWLSLLREMMPMSRSHGFSLFEGFTGLYGSRGRGWISKIAHRAYQQARETSDDLVDSALLRSDLADHPSVVRSTELILSSSLSSHKHERSYHESVLSNPLQSRALEFQFRLYRSRGVRPQFPFWDSEVVEICLRTPSEQKMKRGVPRSLIRSVMGDRLPPMISNRLSKNDFSNSLVRSIAADVQALHDIRSDRNHKMFDYVDPAVFSTAVFNLESENRGIRVSSAVKVWNALNLRFWFDSVSNFQIAPEISAEQRC